MTHPRYTGRRYTKQEGDFNMLKHMLTFTDYLLQEEPAATNAAGNFPLLLATIEHAAKLIADQLRAAQLVDLLGQTGRVNTFGEDWNHLFSLPERRWVPAAGQATGCERLCDVRVKCDVGLYLRPWCPGIYS